MIPAPQLAGKDAASVRAALGDGFALDMVAAVSQQLGIDVVVLDLTGDAYALKVAGRDVIVVRRTAVWPRQNFSLAHELAHLALGSFGTHDGECDASGETGANAFAADLLMPADELHSFDWESMTPEVLADYIWQHGVSTDAVRIRLEALGIATSPAISELLQLNTFALLRRHWNGRHAQPDPITTRRDQASLRRVPTELVTQLEQRVAEGQAPAESLAFVLDVPVEEVGIATPEVDDFDADLDLLRELDT